MRKVTTMQEQCKLGSDNINDYNIYNCKCEYEETYDNYDEREYIKIGWGYREKLYSQFKQQFNRTPWFRIRSRTFKIKY